MKKESIQRALHQYIQDQKICGASYAFLSDNSAMTHYEGVAGCIDPYRDQKLGPGYRYDLASLTKVVATTTRILQLIDEKKISYHTSVSDILHQFHYDQVTIRDLLLHRSGLPQDLTEKETLTKENIINRIYDCKVSNYHTTCYSDIGFILLGFLIETIDGMNLEETTQKHIFEKLHMYDTSFICKNTYRYIPTEITIDRGCICKEPHDRKAHLLGGSGSAGLFSTLDDIILYAQAILNEDERLFTKDTYLCLKQTILDERGLGFEKPYGSHILYHTGFTGTSILLDLDKKNGFILLTNRIHPTRYQTDFLSFRKQLNELYLEE